MLDNVCYCSSHFARLVFAFYESRPKVLMLLISDHEFLQKIDLLANIFHSFIILVDQTSHILGLNPSLATCIVSPQSQNL